MTESDLTADHADTAGNYPANDGGPKFREGVVQKSDEQWCGSEKFKNSYPDESSQVCCS